MIDNDLDNLLDIIKKTDIYQTYLHILKQVEKNNDIKTIVNDIKNIQKRLVKNKNKDLEETLSMKKDLLYSIPLYQDYLASSKELNNLLDIVKNKMELYLNDLNI